MSKVRAPSRTVNGFLAAVIILALFTACEKSQNIQSGDFASYKDIPGVTSEEISAIEALREDYPPFVDGMLSTTESFKTASGEIGGFTPLFCGWLSRLFGIQFKPTIYEWGDLVNGINNNKIDLPVK